METELIVLAETGAAALVKAMATDLWPSTKKAVIALFRRGDPIRAGVMEAQLDRNDTFVGNAESPDDARGQVFGFWALELAGLLNRDPSCRDVLAQLIGNVCAAIADNSRPPTLVQSNTAHDRATLFATQSGDQHINAPTAIPLDPS